MTAIQQKQLILLLAAALIGALAGYLQYAPPKADTKATNETEWPVPIPPNPAAVADAYRQLSQHYQKSATLDVNNPTSEQPSSTLTWTLHGLIRQGVTPFALIKSNDKIKRYQLGDVLPDSSKLIEIDNNGIKVELIGNTTTISLHSRKPK